MLRKRLLSCAALALLAPSTWAQQPPDTIPIKPASTTATPAHLGAWEPVASGGAGAAETKETPIAALAVPDQGVGGTPCDDTCRRGGIVAGGGFYFLRPYWETNLAFSTTTTVPGGSSNLLNRDFSWDTEAVPYGYVGAYTSCGLGARARFMDFDSQSQTESFTIPTVPGAVTTLTSPTVLNQGVGAVAPGTVVEATSTLEFWLLDVEMLKRSGGEFWSLEVSAGARYLDITQGYRLVSAPPGGAASSLIATHSFEGIGPTFSIEGSHSLAGSGLSVFGSSRMSILFGDEDQLVVREVPGGGGLVTNTGSNPSHGVLPIGEIELGLRYQKRFGRILSFVEVAGVGQVWWGAGNSAGASEPSFTSAGPNMGLLGGRVAVGFNY